MCEPIIRLGDEETEFPLKDRTSDGHNLRDIMNKGKELSYQKGRSLMLLVSLPCTVDPTRTTRRKKIDGVGLLQRVAAIRSHM